MGSWIERAPGPGGPFVSQRGGRAEGAAFRAPLSFQQEQMLILWEQAPQSHRYHTGDRWRLRGASKALGFWRELVEARRQMRRAAFTLKNLGTRRARKPALPSRS